MTPSVNLAAPLLCAALLLSAEHASAQGQSATSRPSKAEILRQQGSGNGRGAASAPRNYPLMSNDFLTGLEALGVRPGMTLRAAQAQAAQWGADLKKDDQRNLSELAKPSPANPYTQSQITGAFVYSSAALKNYSGHPYTFNPDTPVQTGRVGAVTVIVYPLNPLGDLADPDNLMVYFVRSEVMSAGSRAGVMSEAAFLSQGAQRIGQKLHTALSDDRADCGFLIPDYAQRIIKLAEVAQPQTPAHLAAWTKCGPVAMVVPGKTGERVNSYRVAYSDGALAERAFKAFRVYGSEHRRTP